MRHPELTLSVGRVFHARQCAAGDASGQQDARRHGSDRQLSPLVRGEVGRGSGNGIPTGHVGKSSLQSRQTHAARDPNALIGTARRAPMNMKPTRDELTVRAIKVIGLVMLAVLLATIVAKAADVVLVFFGGILLAILLRGCATLLSARTGLSRKMSLAIVLSGLLALIALGSWLLFTQMAEQFEQLSASLVHVWRELRVELHNHVWGRQVLALLSRAQADAADGAVAQGAGRAFSTTLGALVNFAVIVFIGVYVAVDPGWYRRGFLRLIAPARRARAREILDAIGHTLQWWLLGRALGMTIVGVVTTIGLHWLGVPFALGLGVLAGALDFVPFAGPVIAAIPGLLVATGGGSTQLVAVLLLYAGIQLLEGYVLTPLIEQRSVHLPPALTIAMQVLLGVLVGAVGVAVATPLTAVCVVLIKKLYVEGQLESRGESQR